jgi:hypothetical protein
MRLLAILALVALFALLAWQPFASEEEAPYRVLGSGAELCTEVASKPAASGDAPLAGLLRITCDLDAALLSLENYYRDSLAATGADPSDTLFRRLRASRHKPGR